VSNDIEYGEFTWLDRRMLLTEAGFQFFRRSHLSQCSLAL